MSEQSERRERGLMIAARTKLTQKGDVWRVPSQSGHKPYYEVDPKSSRCTYPDFEKREAKCKHIYAVEITIERESSTTTTTSGDTTTTTTTETVKIRYKQMWKEYNSAQTNEKSHFLALLYELCSGIDEPIQTMGRTRIPMADMIFAAVYKIYSTVSTRRFMSDLKEAYHRRYISKIPCYNSIINYLEHQDITPYLQWLITRSAVPLKAVETQFAVTTCTFAENFESGFC